MIFPSEAQNFGPNFGQTLTLDAEQPFAYTAFSGNKVDGEDRMSTGLVTGPLMAGKRGLIMGLANDKSIAWGIAQAIAAQGAEIAFSYQGEALKKRVEPLAASIGMNTFVECDVADEASIDALFAHLAEMWGKIDFVVHAIGFSDKAELRGRYVDTSRANFLMTMDISVYSFTAVCQRASAMMNQGGSLLTLTYYGAEKVMPHYNVMGIAKAGLEASVKYLAEDLGKDGIRVNAISAGPIKTLAASGIGDFRYIMKWNELNSPLRRNVTQEEVGKAALYLLSDLGSGTTGENLHVDAGYHVVGMKAVDAPDIDVVTGRKD
jgi:enoyl-[acyl-carrier protein] reductase I